jgi:hypothetical protein
MTRFNDFVRTEDSKRQDIDDILTFDSQTADVYRVGAEDGAGFSQEVSDLTLYNRISIKLGRHRGLAGGSVTNNRSSYMGICVETDIQLDDLLVIAGQKYLVKGIDKTDARTELDLIKQL